MNNNSANILFDQNGHRCIAFHSLVQGHGIQSNQFLLIDGDHVALIDPGGDLTFTPLSIQISKYINIANLEIIFASHQDPDIISSLPRWLMHTDCKVATSRLWSRFLPHLASTFVNTRMESDIAERMIEIPDNGLSISFGKSVIKCLPAHYLHSVGNFQFYDPVSKILFSGDMGASLVEGNAGEPVDDFDKHVPLMEKFHQRYMGSQKVTALWADMIRQLDVEMIVPQHGKPFAGRAVIDQFLNWISNLKCGIDLLRKDSFRLP